MESVFPDLLNGLGDEPKYHYETNVNVLERENRQENLSITFVIWWRTDWEAI